MLDLFKSDRNTPLFRRLTFSILVFWFSSLAITIQSFAGELSDDFASEMPVLVGIGGDFIALDSDNQKITQSHLKGKPVLMAFGYTNCADICPITVGYMRNVHAKLSPQEQGQVQFVFVTVDPEYDTPAHLKAYLAHFSSDFIGITGTREQIDKIVDNYKVDYHRLSNDGVPTKYIRRIEEKKMDHSGSNSSHESMNHDNMDHGTGQMSADMNPDEQSKLYTHSAHLFVIDREMQARALAHTGTPRDEVASMLRHLITE